MHIFKNKWMLIIKTNVFICLFCPSDDDFLSLRNKLGKENMKKKKKTHEFGFFFEYRQR